jgi:pimeloyl-ACP methyl ester carboxylesterase
MLLSTGVARSFTDDRRGVSERLEVLHLSGTPSVGAIDVPRAGHDGFGWVICHSFGMEQTHLQPFEVQLARELAAAGFAVLRFHARGYGDTLMPAEDIRPATHVQDAIEAAGWLIEETSVGRLGFIGARFGGAVAALAADRMRAHGLAAIDPVIRGSSYGRALVRTGVVSELAGKGRPRAGGVDAVEALRRDGVLDVEGFPLTLGTFEELNALDLTTSVAGFCGPGLILGLGRSQRPDPLKERLAEHWRNTGAPVDRDEVVHPQATRFGMPRFRRSVTGGKTDTQAELTDEIVERVVRWADRRVGAENRG